MNNKHSLGGYLRNIRIIKGYTLEDIEKLTNKEIDSIYLSKIETGRIVKLDDKTLLVLSEIYDIYVFSLIRRADAPFTITKNNNEDLSIRGDSVDIHTDWKDLTKKVMFNFFQTLNLTDYEEEELISYLAFLRTK